MGGGGCRAAGDRGRMGVAYVVLDRMAREGFEKRRDDERARLLARVAEPAAVVGDPKYADVGGIPAGREGHADAEFTSVLVEYYAYGLTQARSSFATSQRFAGPAPPYCCSGWRWPCGRPRAVGICISAW